MRKFRKSHIHLKVRVRVKVFSPRTFDLVMAGVGGSLGLVGNVSDIRLFVYSV